MASARKRRQQRWHINRGTWASAKQRSYQRGGWRRLKARQNGAADNKRQYRQSAAAQWERNHLSIGGGNVGVSKQHGKIKRHGVSNA